MGSKLLMKGNEAIGETAIRAGCRHYFGYPITPQSEVPEYLARRMPEVDGVFLQAESELAAISMVYGAAGAGARVMTSSSSPGISLQQEGISYLAAAELPTVIINMVRGGPGIGSIAPSQADYYQSTRGGGHGDYRLIVLAPSSVQELVDLTWEAFVITDRYRNPVLVLGDGMLGQMMEAISLPEHPAPELPRPWATDGCKGRKHNEIFTLFLKAEELEENNQRLARKISLMEQQEQRWDEYFTEDAELVVVAYGIAARVGRRAVKLARDRGIKVGLFRPISLWPYPSEALSRAADKASSLLVVELNLGQMIDDVKLALGNTRPVHFYGKTNIVPSPEEILTVIENMAGAGR